MVAATPTRPRDPSDLVAVFCAGRSGEVPEGLGEVLARLCSDTRAAHPALDCDDGELVAAVAMKCPSEGVLAYLERCHGGDVVLARRAARGDSAAIADLERVHRATIDRVCRRFASADHAVDDLRQLLREKLFTGSPRDIDHYNGEGRLDSWLRVTAMRLFIDLGKRKDRAREVADRDDRTAALADPADLGLELIKAEYRAATRAAIEHAAAMLAPGDRHLLRQHLVAGLTIDQLGAALGIHRATAARRIAKAREQMIAATRRELERELALSTHELDEMQGLVMSRLDLSIGKLLASRP